MYGKHVKYRPSVTSVTPPQPAKGEIGTLPLASGGSSGVEKKDDVGTEVVRVARLDRVAHISEKPPIHFVA